MTEDNEWVPPTTIYETMIIICGSSRCVSSNKKRGISVSVVTRTVHYGTSIVGTAHFCTK